MEGMKQYPDKYFDLAVVDPPYGIGVNVNMGRRKGYKKSNYHKFFGEDLESPNKEYFKQLFRVSKNQIVWGANHFISKMPFDSPCWLMWDKGFSEDVTFAQYELAYTSFKTTCKKYDKHPNLTNRIHPTQKPIALYDWIFKNYATPGMKILDTHVGSMSSVISAIKYGCTIHAYEMDADYFAAGKQRVEDYFKQGNLFSDKPEIIFSDSQTESLR